MGLEEPTEFNFRAGSLSAMDVPAAVLSAIKYVEETKKPVMDRNIENVHSIVLKIKEITL